MERELCRKYQKKTDKQHVLDNPEPYTGAMESTPYDTFVWDEGSGSFEAKELQIIPGLYKLFDEAVVNARDHYVRQAEAYQSDPDVNVVTKIDFTIDESGLITVRNDGDGIDITEHPEHKVFIPELIFGHLRTSTNYDKTEKRTGGGRNGLGFKLALIWSTHGSVETVDSTRGLKYYQTFTANLSEISKPKITKARCKPYTQVTFKPDFARLGIDGFSPSMRRLMHRRVHDVAAVTPSNVKVSLNGEKVECKGFLEYAKMFHTVKTASNEIVHEKFDSSWEYAVCVSEKGQFGHVSMVNGIFTTIGGKHVDFITNQIVKALQKVALSSKKVDVKPAAIKEQLFLFLRCDIPNPIFDSQTKDCLMTPPSKFDTDCKVSAKFVKKLIKMGIVDTACHITDARDRLKIAKQDSGKKSTVSGIPKLVDAHYAGTKKNSGKAILLIVEGDSAKAGVMSGLSKSDRHIYGIYPLKGKLMNVRGELPKRVAANKEISEIKKVVGLESGKVYKTDADLATLRYGQILFLTDQDKDGTHIKALGINLLHSEWASLLIIPKFVGFMSTPILRATKGAAVLSFYSEREYEEWKAANEESARYKIKYYKGLGTSSSKEFKEYFKDQRIVLFNHSGRKCDCAIDLVFNKSLPDARKTWLGTYDAARILSSNTKEIDYASFMNDDMIHFSKYDCDRSIPNMMDGFKTSQRKTLFGFMKRGTRNEIKVAQISGYISEHSCYHHGEASLNGTIVGMAQNFVGSNNINLLQPNGQFGTRLQGGKDSASERYIFTQLSKITSQIFKPEDSQLLNYLDDDGTRVEPEWYAPVIPMLLVNGARGIGTGFSTYIPPHDPVVIIEYMIATLKGTALPDLYPFFKGSTCKIRQISKLKYECMANYTATKEGIVITDLPPGYWTDDLKTHLEKLMSLPKNKRVIRNYKDESTDTVVDMTVNFVKGKLDSNARDKVSKLLKLKASISLSNMHAFNESQILTKYSSASEILDEFMKVRIGLYARRKALQLATYEREMRRESEKMRFVTLVLSEEINLKNDEEDIRSALEGEFKFDCCILDVLLALPIRALNKNNVEKLKAKCDELRDRHRSLKARSIEGIWLQELEQIKSEYEKSC